MAEAVEQVYSYSAYVWCSPDCGDMSPQSGEHQANGAMTFMSQHLRWWALFLDRDGVINELLRGGTRYITALDHFHLMEGAAEGIEWFRRQRDTAIVMTNQRCLAAGLISNDMRHQIHERIRDLLRARGRNGHRSYSGLSPR